MVKRGSHRNAVAQYNNRGVSGVLQVRSMGAATGWDRKEECLIVVTGEGRTLIESRLTWLSALV